MGVGVAFSDFGDGGVGEVVVVVMGYDNGIDYGYVGDVAGRRGVALWAQPGEGGAAVFENRVEQDAETAGEFNQIAGVAKPSGAEFGGGGAGGEEFGGADRHCGRGCVRVVAFA